MENASYATMKKSKQYKKCIGEITDMAKKLISENKIEQLVEKILSGEGIEMLKSFTDEV